MCYPSNRIQQANGMNGTGLIVVSPFWQSFSRNSRVVRCLQLVPTRVLFRPISTKLWRHSGTLPNRKTPPLPRGKLVQKPTYCNPQFIICSSHHTNCKLKRCAKSVHMHPKSNSKNKTTYHRLERNLFLFIPCAILVSSYVGRISVSKLLLSCNHCKCASLVKRANLFDSRKTKSKQPLYHIKSLLTYFYTTRRIGSRY